MALSREIISFVGIGFKRASFSWSNDELQILQAVEAKTFQGDKNRSLAKSIRSNVVASRLDLVLD